MKTCKTNTTQNEQTHFSTLMLSKTSVTFSSNSPCQGYVTADTIMVLSNLKEPIKRLKTGRVKLLTLEN